MEEEREEGLRTGMLSLTLKQLRRLFGQVDQATEDRIRALPNQLLEELAEVLLKFASPEDLNRWLDVHPPEASTQVQ